ncbi:hypothetical protein B4100_0623 [Heyndrickxia coagulans]|nr:hypothetical protein B4100_0623 [Heyndrickxia coagulans]
MGTKSDSPSKLYLRDGLQRRDAHLQTAFFPLYYYKAVKRPFF